MMNELLSPAEETFTEFKGIIVKSEEELDGQRRLLDFSRIPLIILHRIVGRGRWPLTLSLVLVLLEVSSC
ncbi:hypothetical protein AMECASPLE_034023 [Ameca splendens]|uniref:Uncharacterized protein n=1 Tax=Ameca splendens TaxID=208324 RepID=A0ABV0ZSL5_9TELE